MKIRSTSLLSAVSFIALFVVITASGQGGSEYLIKNDSVGGIRLGMTIAEAKKLLKGATFTRSEDEGRDSIEVKQGGVTLMYFFARRGDDNYDAPINESTKITGILVLDSRYRTVDGIHIGSPISEVEKVFGKLKEIVLYDYDESEHATFPRQPAILDLTVRRAGRRTEGLKVGIYKKGESTSKTYVAGSLISAIALEDAVDTESPADPANLLIKRGSAGDIRLGMTIAEARSAMKGMTFARTSDGEGVALISVKQGDVQLMTLYADEADPQRPIDETARIMNIEVWDQRFKTTNGIHPKMKLVDAEKIIGKVKQIIRSEIESREYAEFVTKTAGFIYRLMGPVFEAGIYPKGMRETTRYVANTYIYTISIAQERSPDAVE